MQSQRLVYMDEAVKNNNNKENNVKGRKSRKNY